jgi:hypothetical protein
MSQISRDKLIKLLKSGNFTVASHDYGQVVIYEGRVKGYTEFDEKTEMPKFKGAKEVARFNLGDTYGYMQDVVSLFTEALGGSNGGSA